MVTHYDCNGDGRVDYELHEIPRMADVGWALRDSDFDGRYDLRYDFAYTYPPITGPSHIDIPVPSLVHITRGKPPDGFAGDRPSHQ